MSDRFERKWNAGTAVADPVGAANGKGHGPSGYVELGGLALDAFEAGVEQLRDEARRLAHADAECGVPDPDSDGPTESEVELRKRAMAYFERWRMRERRRLTELTSGKEQRIADGLARASLGIDRFQRTTNDLIRLRARYELRKREVAKDLEDAAPKRDRGLPTPLYVVSLVFLGLVEFFANAPVFGTLLPRDPLTERQIRLLTEASAGWWSGLERVGAHIIFRPDAALLAAGVITFLCVLAHFFGHSLRDLMMQGERQGQMDTVHSRSVRENVVPVILSAIGLALTLGVLFEARVQLGEVGAERYTADLEQVEELRRQAGWLRVDGEILAANELTNRAEDMEHAATELREYSQSMARMNFPILLLNLTLVLCAISAAYFHRRDGRREQFNELPFESDRRTQIERGEACAEDASAALAEVLKEARELRDLSSVGAAGEWRSALLHLESIFATYRAENGRARRIDPQSIAAFRKAVRLKADRDPREVEGGATLKDPEVYLQEREALAERFAQIRTQFTDEAAAAW